MVVDQRELQSSGRGGRRRAGGGAVGDASDRSRSDGVGLRRLLQRLSDDDGAGGDESARRRRWRRVGSAKIRRRGPPSSLQRLIDACGGQTRRFQATAAVACGGSSWRSTPEQFPTGQRRRRWPDAAAAAAARQWRPKP